MRGAGEEMAAVVGAIAVGRAVRSRPPACRCSAKPRLWSPVPKTSPWRRCWPTTRSSVGLRVSGVIFEAWKAGAGAMPYVADGAAFANTGGEFIDLAIERARLQGWLLATKSERASGKLANPDFVLAPPRGGSGGIASG